MNTQIKNKIAKLVSTLVIEEGNEEAQFNALLAPQQLKNFATEIIQGEELEEGITATEIADEIEVAIEDTLRLEWLKTKEEQDEEEWRKAQEHQRAPDGFENYESFLRWRNN